jgi:steroid 5-alpha reductase family enzyme
VDGICGVCDYFAVGICRADFSRVDFVFLRGVTGIPTTEAQALRSRGDAYREYQRRTSAFVPWFPKKLAGEKAGG